jgi:microcystin-dependent protein
MGQGLGLTNRVIGERAGTESVTLTTGQLPGHAHPVLADTTQGNVTPPGPTVIPSTAGDPGSLPSLYVVPGTSAITPTAMAAGSIGNTGGNGAHENRMPSLALNYLIAVDGVFPSQS